METQTTQVQVQTLANTEVARTATVFSVETIKAGKLGTLELVVWKVDKKIHKNRYFFTLDGMFSAEMRESTQYFIQHPEYGAEHSMHMYYMDTLKGVNDDKMPSIITRAKYLQYDMERLASGKYKHSNYEKVIPIMKWFKECFGIEPIN